MAIIRWQDIAVPNLHGVQEGYRTASQLLQRAVDSGRGATEEIAKYQQAVKDSEQQTADRLVTQAAMQIQDPDEYARRIADGSLMGPAADHVSMDLMNFVDSRRDTLRSRADTQYQSDRTRTRDAQRDAASAILDEAARAVHEQGLSAGLKYLDGLDLSLEDRQKAENHLRGFLRDPLEAQALANQEMDAQAAMWARRIQGAGNDPTKQLSIYESIPDDQVALRTSRLLDSMGENFSQRVSGSQATLGITGTGASNGFQYGHDRSLGRRFGNTVEIALANGAPPPPGSEAWQAATGRKTPSMQEVYDWNQQYMLPASGEWNTTATGPGQLVNLTRRDFMKRYGEELFGTTDMSQVPWTFENERKLLRKVYEEQGPKAWDATKNYAAFRDTNKLKKKYSFNELEPLLYAIDGGVLPDNYQADIIDYNAHLETMLGDLSTGAKVIRNARQFAGDDLFTVANKVAQQLGAENPREVEGFIRKTVERARRKGISMSEAEAGGLLLNSLEEDWPIVDWSNFNSYTNVLDEKLDHFRNTHDHAREELKVFEGAVAANEKLIEYLNEYQAAETDAIRALEVARSRENADEAAVKAFQRLNRISKKIGSMLEPAQDFKNEWEADKEAARVREEARLAALREQAAQDAATRRERIFDQAANPWNFGRKF